MTKKIAILTSNNSKILEAITEYFKDNKDVEITCLSDIVDSEPLKKRKNLALKTDICQMKKTPNILEQIILI